MAKANILTRDTEILSQTICNILKDKDLFQPLDAHNLLMAATRLHFSVSLHWDKIFGRWVFTNMSKDEWSNQSKDIVELDQFAFSDITAEMAMARGIHYYFNLRIDERDLN